MCACAQTFIIEGFISWLTSRAQKAEAKLKQAETHIFQRRELLRKLNETHWNRCSGFRLNKSELVEGRSFVSEDVRGVVDKEAETEEESEVREKEVASTATHLTNASQKVPMNFDSFRNKLYVKVVIALLT